MALVRAVERLVQKLQKLRRKAREYLWRLQGRAICLPEKWIRAQDYCNSGRAVWHPAYMVETTGCRPSRQTGSRLVHFMSLTCPGPFESGVSEIEGASVLGVNGWTVSEDGRVIADFCQYDGMGKILFHEKGWHQVTRKKGTCLSLVNRHGFHNYAHWLLESLTRLEVFKKAGFSLESVDHFYCVSPQKEHRQFFYRIGIPENKCIWGEPARAILPDRLLMLNGPFWNYCANPWAVDFLRRHFQPQVAKPWRKIYIRRTGRRKIINETELLPHLEAMGFEIYEWKEGVDRQIQFFAESSVVVGVHGADLANIIFCVPGSRVLEIVPTDLVARYFYHVSEASGLLHYHLVGDSLTQRPKGDKGTSDADIRVDPAEFRQALEQICQP